MQVERQAAFATLNAIYTDDNFPKFIGNFTAALRKTMPVNEAKKQWIQGVATKLAAVVEQEGLAPFKEHFDETYKPLLLCSVIRFIADSAGNHELSRKVSKLVFEEFSNQQNIDHALSVVTIDPDFAKQNSPLILPVIKASITSDNFHNKLAKIFFRTPYFQKATADLHLISAEGYRVHGHTAFLKRASSVISTQVNRWMKGKKADAIPTINLPNISNGTLTALVNFYERHKQFRSTFSPEIWVAANYLDMEGAKEASRALILTDSKLMAQALPAAIMYDDRKLELHCFSQGALASEETGESVTGLERQQALIRQELLKAYQLGFRVTLLENGQLKLTAPLTSQEHSGSFQFMMKRYQFDVLEVLSLADASLGLPEMAVKRLILHADAIEKKGAQKSLSNSMSNVLELTLVDDPSKDEAEDEGIFDFPSLKKLTLCCEELHRFPLFEEQFKSMNVEEVCIEAEDLYLSGQSYVDFQAFIEDASSLKKVQIKTLDASTGSNEIELLIHSCQQSTSLEELALDIGEFNGELFKKLLDSLKLTHTFDEKTSLYHIQLHHRKEAS